MPAPFSIKYAVIMLGGVLALRITSRLLCQRPITENVVLVTGGSRGLGLAIAIECAKRGARVSICGRDPHTLERAAQYLRQTGAHVLPIICDVRERDQITSAIQRVVERFGRLDILVNNAGTIAVGPMETMTAEDYQDALDTHFWAMYYAVESALPFFNRQNAGRIVNITSIGGKISVPHLLPYCVSKFAAVGYSEGLRVSLASKNITVTTVVPGLMRTGSPRNAWFKGQHEKEYTWFALSDALPFSSIAAGSAARQIIAAAMAGESQIVLSLPAQAAVFLNGIAPGFVSRVLQFASRLLPGPGGVESARMRGFQSTTTLSESPLTGLSKKAERDYNQI
jgi:NAD(P)-dependent dehydrogenase (short-subunit alcohol dehydrogenase family)